MSISEDGTYVCVCERSTDGYKGQFSIFEVISQKRRKALPDTVEHTNAFQSREFVASAFSPTNDKLIITLTGQPDWKLILWNWERSKMISVADIGQQGPITVQPQNFQVSFNPPPWDRTSSSVLVTGPQNTFVYLKHKQEESKSFFTQDHSQINNLEEGRNISTNFTCHQWSLETGMILVCTDNGEMILCANNGEYKSYILESPLSQTISAAYSFSTGFLVAVENSFIVFISDPSDERALLRKVGDKFSIMIQDDKDNQLSDQQFVVNAVAVNEHEDQIYVMTSHGQLITAEINLRSDWKRNDEIKFKPVMGHFHKDQITGLDVCIRKELIVTCSKDRSVKIWNYANKTLEISCQQ